MFGPKFQASLVTVWSRTLRSTKAFLEMMLPLNKTGPFDGAAPLLRDSDLTALDKARLFLKVIMQERLIPFIAGMPDSKSDLEEFVKTVLHAQTSSDVATHAAHQEALAEVQELCSCHKSLWSDNEDVASSLAKVDAVMTAKEGNRALLTRQLRQTTFFKTRERALRSLSVREYHRCCPS